MFLYVLFLEDLFREVLFLEVPADVPGGSVPGGSWRFLLTFQKVLSPDDSHACGDITPVS